MSRRLATNFGVSGEFEFTYTDWNGNPLAENTDYVVINDGGRNWRIKFLTSGIFTPAKNVNVDLFAVGGGGAGRSGSGRQAGGGGGYTQTVLAQALTGDTPYDVTVGLGGNNADGGDSSFGELITAGGGKKYAAFDKGGNGGSGGAGRSNSSGNISAVGGSNGSNGENGEGTGGEGQGTTTREFGELTGDLYAGGGAGAPYASTPWPGGDGGGGASRQDGTPNTGGGGGGGGAGGNGGSGIVVIRNAR